jgi:chemotaxis regulatin CheY-phosphate phosphatase CheZ
MKKRASSRSRGGAGRHSPTTDVRTVEDLHATLADLLSLQSPAALGQLPETLLAIRKQFDPRSVTMTSTNIPDAIDKLSATLRETGEATAKVFSLLERQQQLIGQGDDCLSELEKMSQNGSLTPENLARVVGECRSVHKEMQAVGHQVVLAQEVQDLTAQKIGKVRTVVEELDATLRALLSQFHVEIPHASSVAAAADDKDIDQAATDAILKDFGI